LNSSIRLVMSFWLRLGSSAFSTALESERFLIRCAAQSAESSVAGTPQSFSLYVLKKCVNSRLPNRAVTQPARWVWSFGGDTLAQRYDPTQRSASTMPRLRSALPALRG
jgi:hypothetical protein